MVLVLEKSKEDSGVSSKSTIPSTIASTAMLSTRNQSDESQSLWKSNVFHRNLLEELLVRSFPVNFANLLKRFRLTCFDQHLLTYDATRDVVASP
jgi:hypothetical protein